MNYMFYKCKLLKNIDISNFDFKNVKYKENMFDDNICNII
jgi:surface protein